MLGCLAALLWLVPGSRPACASDIAPGGMLNAGPPTDLGQLLIDPRRELWNTGQLGADIAQARDALVAALALPLAHASAPPRTPARASQRLAELLAEKDLHLLVARLARPDDAGDGLGRLRAEASRWFAASELDGGVPKAAQPAFERWVSKVRKFALRLRLDSAAPPTRAVVAAAMQAHAAAYREYTRVRDRVEFERVATRLALDKARRSPNGLPLFEQHTLRFQTARDTRQMLLRENPALRSLAASLARSGARVLRCRYGPIDLWPDGTPRDEEQSHWLDRPPPVIAALIAADATGALGTLGTRRAWSACPQTDRDGALFGAANERALP